MHWTSMLASSRVSWIARRRVPLIREAHDFVDDAVDIYRPALVDPPGLSVRKLSPGA